MRFNSSASSTYSSGQLEDDPLDPYLGAEEQQAADLAQFEVKYSRYLKENSKHSEKQSAIPTDSPFRTLNPSVPIPRKNSESMADGLSSSSGLSLSQLRSEASQLRAETQTQALAGESGKQAFNSRHAAGPGSRYAALLNDDESSDEDKEIKRLIGQAHAQARSSSSEAKEQVMLKPDKAPIKDSKAGQLNVDQVQPREQHKDLVHVDLAYSTSVHEEQSEDEVGLHDDDEVQRLIQLSRQLLKDEAPPHRLILEQRDASAKSKGAEFVNGSHTQRLANNAAKESQNREIAGNQADYTHYLQIDALEDLLEPARSAPSKRPANTEWSTAGGNQHPSDHVRGQSRKERDTERKAKESQQARRVTSRNSNESKRTNRLSDEARNNITVLKHILQRDLRARLAQQIALNEETRALSEERDFYLDKLENIHEICARYPACYSGQQITAIVQAKLPSMEPLT